MICSEVIDLGFWIPIPIFYFGTYIKGILAWDFCLANIIDCSVNFLFQLTSVFLFSFF